jgi:hypothetical protein
MSDISEKQIDYISEEKLYKLFHESYLIEIEDNKKFRENKEVSQSTHEYSLRPREDKKTKIEDEILIPGLKINISPNMKKILSMIDISERRSAYEDMIKDDEKLNLLDEYMDDPDYIEKMENTQLGFYMEKYVSYYIKCPECNEFSLRGYYLSNIPAIDLICINQAEHKHTRYFQVKTSIEHSSYFTKNYVTAGSKRFGHNCHINFIGKKYPIIGYICINLNKISDNKFKINIDNSYVILPKLDSKLQQSYEYIDYKTLGEEEKKKISNKYEDKNIIKFIEEGIIRQKLNQDIGNLEINTDYDFKTKKINNPFSSKPQDETVRKLKYPEEEEEKQNKRTKRPRENTENIGDKKMRQSGGKYFDLYLKYKYLYLHAKREQVNQ